MFSSHTPNIKRDNTRFCDFDNASHFSGFFAEMYGKEKRARKDEILKSCGRSKTKEKLEAPSKDNPSSLFSIFIRNIIIRFGLN